MKFYKNFFKPFFDSILAIILIVVLSPIIFVLIFILYFTNDGQIFFFQVRPGYKGVPFKIIKFKTMKDIVDMNNRQLPDEERVTKIGKIIRSTSLDEILQLFNVVKGDMSLVGPRPLMMQYLTRYSPEQAKRHDVKPGITGLAQVNGRNAISWEQKFQYDIFYVANQSFFLDIKILWKTFMKVINRKDINFNSKITIEEFMG
jgi:undecaprenyl phosphate N,N'-diacetylbacillosamine 1-phosphate transferase